MSIEELLNKDNSVSIQHKKLLMSSGIMDGAFKLRITPHYNLRHTSHFYTDPIHSAYNGTESASYLGPKIWEQIPAEIENKDFLNGFKKEIKK